MAQAISGGTRFMKVQLLRALSPSYRRVRARLAMIEAHHAFLSPIGRSAFNIAR